MWLGSFGAFLLISVLTLYKMNNFLLFPDSLGFFYNIIKCVWSFHRWRIFSIRNFGLSKDGFISDIILNVVLDKSIRSHFLSFEYNVGDVVFVIFYIFYLFYDFDVGFFLIKYRCFKRHNGLTWLINLNFIFKFRHFNFSIRLHFFFWITIDVRRLIT